MVRGDTYLVAQVEGFGAMYAGCTVRDLARECGVGVSNKKG